MTLSMSVIGPLPNGTYAVGYPTPGCAVMTVVVSGMTEACAQAEADRLNQEQEKRAATFQRDRELRMRPETLRPVTDYFLDVELAEGTDSVPSDEGQS